ncbi:hypothetical protein CEXT_624801 [Caerostris extrusa]|uniref:Uncharacterized protein n=1 Tax=Caerostris extrusa TaxID=172846 RepID=A0AAV4Y1K9_CAEEX|nr:hypothetical protein CEXT_624801 [Caerostris extrusa]
MLNGWFIAQRIPAGMEGARSRKHAKTLMAIPRGDLPELGTLPSEWFSTNEFLLNFRLEAAVVLFHFYESPASFLIEMLSAASYQKGFLGTEAISSGNEMIWVIKSDLLSYEGAWKDWGGRSLFRGRCDTRWDGRSSLEEACQDAGGNSLGDLPELRTFAFRVVFDE